MCRYLSFGAEWHRDVGWRPCGSLREFQLIRSVSVAARPPGAVGRGRPTMVKKILTWGLVAFLIFFVVTKPANAALVAKQLGNGVVDVGDGLGSFFTNLVS